MKALSFYYIIMLISVIFITSCDKDPEIPNEEELITTLQYILTPVGGGPDVILHFTDPDGDGGVPPVITGDTLQNNTTYTGSVLLMNTSVDPWINITDEIRDEASEHQFFFIPANVNVDVAYDDADENSNPVGIETTLSTAEASQGTLQIILRHLPDKTATGVKEGNIQNAGGETDIEVTFPVKVE